MKYIVEVKKPSGDVNRGIGQKSQKPYVVATQECAIFVPGEDYPKVGRADVRVENTQSGGEVIHWHKPGRYEAELRISVGRFGDFELRFDFRNMQPVSLAKAA